LHLQVGAQDTLLENKGRVLERRGPGEPDAGGRQP
jgi:hypothetical protein